MLREVGKIYSRALRMFFQYRIFGRLSLSYFVVNYLLSSLLAFARNQRSVGWVVSIQWIDSAVDFVLLTGLPLAFILIVYRIERGGDLQEVFQQTKQNFWKFIGQYLAGLFLALLYTLPFLCLLLFLTFAQEKLFLLIFIFLFLLVLGFLGLGSISLGQRILLDKGEGAFSNSLQGLRILNGNLAFFITLYFVNTLISTIQISLHYLVGSAITGVDLFSVPISNFSLFMMHINTAIQTPFVYGMDIVLGTILYPIFAIVPTLAYLRFKDFDASRFSRRRTPSTEN
jgi:hypothetical protein